MGGAAKFFMLIIFFFINTPRLWAADEATVEIPTLTVSGQALTIDGSLDDRIWRSAAGIKLEPAIQGMSPQPGGSVQLVVRGGDICLASFLPEPGGRVLARSVGYNPVWEKDIVTSPVVEDLLIINLAPGPDHSDQSALKIEINPWGACRVERNGRQVPSSRILAAANISTGGWYVECAIPLNELCQGSDCGEIGVSVTRFRSRRPQDPEFRWKSSKSDEYTRFRLKQDKSMGGAGGPSFSPPEIGNTDPALRVGYVQAVPAVDFNPDDPFWKRVKGFRLLRNEPSPRDPCFPTEIKWVHDWKRLAVLFHCTEDARVDCETGARDGNVASDDHVCIYLATSGSSFIEIQINPVGTVRDAKGEGPHMSGTSSGAWTGDIETDYLINSDAWYLRVNLPLDQIAQALGEKGLPREWKVLIGRIRRSRIGETEEISTNPVIGNPYLLAPARYRKLRLTDEDPVNLLPDQKEGGEAGFSGLAGELSKIDSHVFSRVQRKYLEITDMLDRYFVERIKTIAMQEHRQWEQVGTLQQWEEFRDSRVERLKKSLGGFPEGKAPLLYQESGTCRGNGYQVKNIAFQSRPGFFVAANLYLPAELRDNMPGIVIIPSHHYPKIQGEMKDCGIVWARCGCAVLILESLGYGERVEVNPWYRQPYHSESQLELQLNLIGQSRLGWIAWDVMRSVDLLCERGNIDPEKLILIGSVTWGGGRPASIAGLLDKRFAAVIPFNWGRVYWESYGIRRSVIDHITPWITCAAIAPRKFVYAHEFSWEGEEGHALPSISVPAWPRYNKVYHLYGAENNLKSAQGKGILRVPETMGDCYSLGAVQRKPLYHILNEWFDIPLPAEDDMNIELDSWLSFGGIRSDLGVVKFKESRRRMPDSALLSITPETDARIERKALHELALDMAGGQLRDSREKLAKLALVERREKLAGSMAEVLGDLEPAENPEAELRWERSLTGAAVEAVNLSPEPGIMVPLLVIKPDPATGNSVPVVIALAEGGKDRFIKQRSREIERLLQKGIAVCLPDVRGTGETAPSQYNRSPDLADRAMDLGETLLGLRIRDVRAVLSYIRRREDLDSRRIALWGESFAPGNPDNLWVDELATWPVSPRIQHFASPLGAHLALFVALFDKEIRAVAARGALESYCSLLERNITYMPFDIIIPKVFQAGDISDICASLAPVPLLIEGFVDGGNRVVGTVELQKKMSNVLNTYGDSKKAGALVIRDKQGVPDLISWLSTQLE